MQNINSRLQNSGFTIIEVLVMVIIVLMLAAVIMPRFLDVEGKVQQLKVRENMKLVQRAADAFAVSNKGLYPIKADDPAFKSFFPGGNANSQSPEGGNYPENPFTHIAESPLNGSVVDINQARFSPPLDLGGPRAAGKIFYNAIIPHQGGNPIGYAIVGVDKEGRALSGPAPNLTNVLSNLLPSIGPKLPALPILPQTPPALTLPGTPISTTSSLRNFHETAASSNQSEKSALDSAIQHLLNIPSRQSLQN
jgi:type II secretory pathway pseudopilin PulG